jgi:rhodanese-related sulfurtransferase
MDPKSVAETKAEVARARGCAALPGAGLDEKGLPPGYLYNPKLEVTPRQVKRMFDAGEGFLLVDCRLPNEYQITRIDGAKLMPLQQLPQFLPERKRHRDRPIVVHCKMGGRSLQFVQALRQAGFDNARSMAGGILLWNKDIAPGGPQY